MAPSSIKCAVVGVCCAALGSSAMKVKRAHSAVHIVGEVQPENYEDVVAKGVDTSRMNKLHIRSFDQSDYNVTIMGYPKREDKEISGSLNYDSNWEPFHTRELCSPWTKTHLRGNFLDVGANIGTYSLPMAHCIAPGGNGTVLSIEGMPDIADHYRAGIVENKATNVALYPYAVGNPDGPDHVIMTLDPENKGGSSVLGNKEGDRSMLKAGIQEVKVPLTTLDTMLQKDKRLKAVLSAKVDIEGNEGRFLQGAEEFFTHHTPCFLMIELIHEWLDSAGTPLPDILAMLTRVGYHRVPTYEHLTHCAWRQRTIHLHVKDLAGCYKRVDEAYEASM